MQKIQYQKSRTVCVASLLMCCVSQGGMAWQPVSRIARPRTPSAIVKGGRKQSLKPLGALVPLAVYELENLLDVNQPSGDQYAAYWGRTSREKYNRTLESAIVTFLGVFFAYFMSFVVGGFIATIIGGIFAFWAILSPDLKARQRNWEFLGGRPLVDPWSIDKFDDENKQGLYGGLYLGRVDDVSIVEDPSSIEEFPLEEFMDYTMETDEMEQQAGTPYLLRLRLADKEGRELQVHARLSEDYLDIQNGMPAAAIILSKSQSFSSLAGLTDVMVPDAGCFVGDYPYLNRPEVDALFSEDDELWESLQSESTGLSSRGRLPPGDDFRALPPSTDERDDYEGKLERGGRRRRRDDTRALPPLREDDRDDYDEDLDLGENPAGRRRRRDNIRSRSTRLEDTYDYDEDLELEDFPARRRWRDEDDIQLSSSRMEDGDYDEDFGREKIPVRRRRY